MMSRVSALNAQCYVIMVTIDQITGDRSEHISLQVDNPSDSLSTP